MDEFYIRPAGVEDAPEVLRERIQMMVDMNMGTAESRAAIQPATLAFLTRALESGEYRGWFACDETGMPIAGGGVLLVDWPPSAFDQKPKRPYIINMYTEPRFRRRGLAKRILGCILEYLRSEGYATARLNASADGRPVYTSLGFHDSNEMTFALGQLS
jgi:GNAT superfamily N-acetyltransferase